MNRRSGRLKSKALQNTENLKAKGNRGDDQADDPYSRKKATVQALAKATAEKQVKLHQLTEMSLDILFEIFRQLKALDVLHLARTTLALRDILMRRSATTVWKQAIFNEGLPPCPEGITEPQYVSLAFDPYCHFCFSLNAHTILWSHRTRACKKCLHSKYARLLGKCFAGEYSLTESSELIKRTHPLIPHSSQTNSHRGRLYKSDVYSKAEAEGALQRLTALADNPLERDAYIAEAEKRVDEIHRHAALCEAWHDGLMNARKNDLDGARNRRRDAIRQKLRQLGWGREVIYMETYRRKYWQEHSYVKVAKDLTEKEWLNVESALVNIMRDARKEILQGELDDILSDRRYTLVSLLDAYILTRPPNVIVPRPADVYLMPGFNSLIENTDPEVEITDRSFADLMLNFPELCEAWRKKASQKLLSLIPDNYSTTSKSQAEAQSTDLSPLYLATMSFWCPNCHAGITYPRILTHRCLTEIPRNEPHGHEYDDLKSLPWSYSRVDITFNVAGSEAAKTILQCLRLSPTTTSHELDKLDPWLECVTCADDFSGRLVMPWRKAVDHAVARFHATKSKCAVWAPLKDEDTRIAKEKSEAVHADCPVRYIACIHCRSSNFGHLAEHLRESHDIQTLSKEDYYHPVDLPTDYAPLDVRIKQ